jgi:hypothetical protein
MSSKLESVIIALSVSKPSPMLTFFSWEAPQDSPLQQKHLTLIMDPARNIVDHHSEENAKLFHGTLCNFIGGLGSNAFITIVNDAALALMWFGGAASGSASTETFLADMLDLIIKNPVLDNSTKFREENNTQTVTCVNFKFLIKAAHIAEHDLSEFGYDIRRGDGWDGIRSLRRQRQEMMSCC